MTLIRKSSLAEGSPAVEALTVPRLLALLRVIDAGGYAAAARGDPSAQSLMNRQVRTLERALGKLTCLEQGRVRPTPAGLELCGLARTLFEGTAALAQGRSQAKVDVTLAAGDSVLQWLVIPRLGAMGEAFPGLRMILETRSRPFDDVVAGRALVAIAPTSEAREAMRQATVEATMKQLGRVRWSHGLFASRGLLPVGAGLAEGFASLPFARVDDDRGLFERAARSLDLEPPAPKLCCETFPQAAAAVATGRFAAVLPCAARAILPAEVRCHEFGEGLTESLGIFARVRTLDAYPLLRGAIRGLTAP